MESLSQAAKQRAGGRGEDLRAPGDQHGEHVRVWNTSLARDRRDTLAHTCSSSSSGGALSTRCQGPATIDRWTTWQEQSRGWGPGSPGAEGVRGPEGTVQQCTYSQTRVSKRLHTLLLTHVHCTL